MNELSERNDPFSHTNVSAIVRKTVESYGNMGLYVPGEHFMRIPVDESLEESSVIVNDPAPTRTEGLKVDE